MKKKLFNILLLLFIALTSFGQDPSWNGFIKDYSGYKFKTFQNRSGSYALDTTTDVTIDSVDVGEMWWNEPENTVAIKKHNGVINIGEEFDTKGMSYTDSIIASLASGGVKAWYFTKLLSGISTYYLAQDTIPTSPLQTITSTATDGESTVATFITSAEVYRVTEGNRTFYFNAKVSDATKDVQLKGEIYLCNLAGNYQILLRTSSLTPKLTESMSMYQTNVWGNSLLINDTTRIIFKIIAIKGDPAGTDPTVSFYVCDNTFSRLDVPVPSLALGEIVKDTIIDGVTDIAPSQNAVADELALKQNLLTNPVTTPNLGVINTIPHFTSSTNIDSTYIYYVNGKLGLGVTNPQRQLDISMNMQLVNTTFASQNGIIYKNGSIFLHNFNYGLNTNGIKTEGNNLFLGIDAGNLTMGSTATSAIQSSYNTCIGNSALKSNTTGNSNTASGFNSLRSNTTGLHNTASGFSSLRSNTTGSYNTSNGYSSLESNTTGSYNTSNGYSSLRSNTTGSYNTANGYSSLRSNTTGNDNLAIGSNSLYSNTTGNDNVAIGINAGRWTSGFSTLNTTSDYCIFIGDSTAAQADDDQNEVVIGFKATGNGSNSFTYGNSSITKHIFNGGNVGIGTLTPMAKLDVTMTKTTNLNGFNWVNTNINKHRIDTNTSTDTSSCHLSSTPTGSLILHITGKDGSTQFQSDSVSTTISGTLVTPKIKLTTEGGYAVKLTNRTGSNSVKGTVVIASASYDNAFDINPTSGNTPVGIVYESGVATGSECWVVVSGIAEVLIVDGATATRSYICLSSSSVAGRMNTQSTVPAATEHFTEIGHTIESKGSGTNVLVKILTHFN